MQSAGNLACCAKVNIRQNWVLLDPRMREYTPSAGSEQRCDSDYARLDMVASPCADSYRDKAEFFSFAAAVCDQLQRSEPRFPSVTDNAWEIPLSKQKKHLA